ncbi:cytochrome o ubiquinol oxidase subunit IV [Shewanella dokdonensis]|uniref:Cytochrome bo(3) ubiquinol oxidase subunit 4 n=1 Tax=Shewanella dokdonensis TaxID=712036 RepID=A0ABX8DKL5_9GAMM|nr:cytochrome o ubiquinol oxidase subunit IV [Shewanella dokdonensis]MCL1076368.1 cytochrome o ubiquinol oxidase subunit IV [Shewanella dokdonensis]QVK24531.1 cytochrome o ubiquinol oxidase subunit IV [Shewanella dokdonensis]
MSDMANQAAHDDGHGSVKSYLIGFVLSIILTAIPFWAVMTHQLSKPATVVLVVIMAVVQIIVHLKYFLHLDFTPHGKENAIAFIFSAVIIGLVVGLSIWIIYSANALMMYM